MKGSLYGYFKAYVPTIWVHGAFGVGVKLGLGILTVVPIRCVVWILIGVCAGLRVEECILLVAVF